MKFENTVVDDKFIASAIHGARNAFNSWSKSDSYWVENTYMIGEADMNLLHSLLHGKPSDWKFMREIPVNVDITAPLTWWKQADKYKVGTDCNSTSTMHTLNKKPITIECFETDDMADIPFVQDQWNDLLTTCEALRQKYNETKDMVYWRELIRILPESWLQTRTWAGNYAVLRSQYFDRRNHKLSTWHRYCDWIKTLPYAEDLICYEGE